MQVVTVLLLLIVAISVGERKSLDIAHGLRYTLHMNKTLLSLLLVLNFVFGIAAIAEPSHKENRKNSLGVEQYYSNPNIYLFGIIACVGDANCSILKDDKGRKYTNLKFWPYNTMSLYEEPVLFCGDVSEEFNGKRGAIVITYRRQATLNYKGIGCHDLEGVFEVPSPDDNGGVR